MQKKEGWGLSVLTAAALATLATSAQAQERPPRSERALEVLGLLEAELVRVDLGEPGGPQLRVGVSARGSQGTLVLQPQGVRAPGYRLLVQRDDGSLSISPGQAPQSLRGIVPQRPGSRVSASLSEQGLFARILLANGSSLWLEPLAGRVRDAGPDEYVLYQGSDVIDAGKPCAEPVMPGTYEPGAESDPGSTGTNQASSTGVPLKLADMACDVDYEYYASYGSVAAVESRIHAVVDALNLQYERDVGIRHRISTILVRTSPVQPYTATDPKTLLLEFRSEWNTNHTGIDRDIAHLFTGKDLDSNVIGIAYLSAICSSSFGYGLSQSDFSTSFAAVTDLTAHELGHNWSANHCSCPTYTMNPSITAANSFNPSTTIPAIETFRDSRTCLEEGSGEPPTGPGDPEIQLTVAETVVLGTITSGSHLSTHDQDDSHEVVMEAASGGKPVHRTSELVHTWSFDVQPALNYTFFIDAHHSKNVEGDHFALSYSKDGQSFAPMLTVTKTSDDDSLQSYAFPEDVAGTLYVRAEDLDHSPGNGTKDSLHVDQMYVHAELDGVDTTPPSAPTGMSAVPGDTIVSLDWSDNTEPDLAGYDVHRSTSPTGPFGKVNPTLLTTSDWTDTLVTNGTTYHYVVTAVDLSGNVSLESAAVKATPNASGSGPIAAMVAAIQVTTVNQGGGLKQARADVWIVDETGACVPAATVYGRFTGDFNQTIAVTTDAQGRAVFVTSESTKGNPGFTFCVDDVQHVTLNYTPAGNLETCAAR